LEEFDDRNDRRIIKHADNTRDGDDEKAAVCCNGNCERFDIKTRSQTKDFEFLEAKKHVILEVLDDVKI
jgi:hypothetical protein